MKASELMIGDWVMHNRTYPKEMHTPKQVLGIKKMPCAKMPGMYIMLEGVDTHEDNCSPIPLTEEILKANGFGKNFSERYTKGIVPFEVNIRGNNKYITLGGKHFCNCDYVHELQHALRLCGIVELANNFKVN